MNQSSYMFAPIIDMVRVLFIYGNNIKPKQPLTAIDSFFTHNKKIKQYINII